MPHTEILINAGQVSRLYNPPKTLRISWLIERFFSTFYAAHRNSWLRPLESHVFVEMRHTLWKFSDVVSLHQRYWTSLSKAWKTTNAKSGHFLKTWKHANSCRRKSTWENPPSTIVASDFAMATTLTTFGISPRESLLRKIFSAPSWIAYANWGLMEMLVCLTPCNFHTRVLGCYFALGINEEKLSAPLSSSTVRRVLFVNSKAVQWRGTMQMKCDSVNYWRGTIRFTWV